MFRITELYTRNDTTFLNSSGFSRSSDADCRFIFLKAACPIHNAWYPVNLENNDRAFMFNPSENLTCRFIFKAEKIEIIHCCCKTEKRQYFPR